MLEINIINKSFNKNKKTKLIFENTNFNLPNNGLILLKGESGIGKTTLLNMICKLDDDYIGSIKYDNKDITSEFVKNNVSYLMQDNNLIEDISIYDNLNLYEEVTTNDIDNILSKLDILNLKDKKVQLLSSGEKRRVAIARTLLKNPKIIIADEITSNLDNNNNKNIMNILKDIAKNTLVIYSSHDDLTYSYADIILAINNHKIDMQKVIDLTDINVGNNPVYKIKSSYKDKIIFNTIFNIKPNISSILIMAILFLTSLTLIMLSNFDSSRVLTNILNLNNVLELTSDKKEDLLISFKNNNSQNFRLLNIPLNDIEYVYYEVPYINLFATYDNLFISDYIGKLPTSDNEIMIYQILAEDIIYYNYGDTIKNINDLIDKEIEVDGNIFKISGIINQDLTLFNELKTTKIQDDFDINLINLYTGKILNYYSEVIITNQKFIDFLSVKYDIQDSYKRNKKIYISNYDDVYNIIRNNTKDYNLTKILFNRNNFYLYDTEYSNSLTNMLYYLTIVSKVSPIFSILFIVLIIMFTSVFVRDYLDKNNLNICILKLLGFSNQELIKNYSYGILIYSLISIVISLLSFILIITGLNRYLTKIYYFNVSILNISILGLVIYLIILGFVLFVMFINLKRYFNNVKVSYDLRNR